MYIQNEYFVKLTFNRDPGVLNNGQGQVVAIYDWETYAPPTSTGGSGGLGFIGMQATLDSSSSPIGELAARQKAQGWASKHASSFPSLLLTYNLQPSLA